MADAGISFKGLKFEAYLNQSGVSANDNYSLNYNGNMKIQTNDKTVYAPFSDMREPYIQQTGSISKKAIIVFNTSEIKQMQFREISIEVGAINPSALFTKPLIFTWSILDKPFISPK